MRCRSIGFQNVSCKINTSGGEIGGAVCCEMGEGVIQVTEVGGRKSDVGGRKSDVGGQKSEVRCDLNHRILR
jgi:hypothetical protein